MQSGEIWIWKLDQFAVLMDIIFLIIVKFIFVFRYVRIRMYHL